MWRLAGGSPRLQTPNCGSLLILNKPVFAGEIPGGPFGSSQQQREHLPPSHLYPSSEVGTTLNLLCLLLELFSMHLYTYLHLQIHSLLLAKMESLFLILQLIKTL